MNFLIIAFLIIDSVFLYLIWRKPSFIATTTKKIGYVPSGKLELCHVGNHLGEDVRLTKENRTACRNCRITVLRLTE